MKAKELIIAEIERLLSELITNNEGTMFEQGRISAFEDMKLFINSLSSNSVIRDLEKASKEWLVPQLDKSYANYGETKMMELTHFDGYAMLDAIEFGAQWMAEQGETTEGLVICNELTHGYKDIVMSIPKSLNVGDKVIVQIRKEERLTNTDVG